MFVSFFLRWNSGLDVISRSPLAVGVRYFFAARTSVEGWA